MKVALLYNLRSEFEWQDGDPLDADADWDDAETIEEVCSGLRSVGVECRKVGNPIDYFPASRTKNEVVLSLCELARSPFRESVVPALCEFYNIDYFFSTPDVLHKTLDKNIANLVARQAGISVPDWQFVSRAEDIAAQLDSVVYPCIAKPAAEGSGMGIAGSSIFSSTIGLGDAVARLLKDYSGGVLIQAVAPGREFTVGVIEREGIPHALCPIEVKPREREAHATFIYNSMMKADPNLCEFVPLESGPLEGHLRKLALTAHLALGCRDLSRSDFRLDTRGLPQFLEINPLPHLHPEYGDFCRSAIASGLSYQEIWSTIVDNVVGRMRRKCR